VIANNDNRYPDGAALARVWALRANRGIELTVSSEHELLARPLLAEGQPDTSIPPHPLLPVPANLVERCCNLLRHVWRAYGTSAVVWLYFHPGKDTWTANCPPQLCAEKEVQADATFKECDLPNPDLWLAGAIRSDPTGADDVATATPLLPDHQGMHLVLDLSRPLTCLAGFVRSAGGKVHAVPVEPLVHDPLDPDLAYLLDRMVFRSPVDRT
jgi:hypothetical protein